MRPALPWLLALSMALLPGLSCRGRGAGSFLRAAAQAAVFVAAAAASAAASRRPDVPPQPPVLAPRGLAVPGPSGTRLIPALGSVADCPSAPAVEVHGCLQPGIFRSHDSWSACAYFCLDHCEYHGATQATVRPLSPEEAGALGPRRAVPVAPPPIAPPAPPPIEPPAS
jgi:hypothetical protein